MNILIIRSQVNKGGPAMLLMAEAKGLQNRGHNVVVFTGGGSSIEDIKNCCQATYVDYTLQTESNRLKNSLKLIKKIREIIKEHKIDVIYGMNTASTLFAYVASKFIKEKLVIVNSLLGMGKENIIKLCPFDHIVMSEEHKIDLIKKGMNQDKLLVKFPSSISITEEEIEKIDNNNIRSKYNIPISSIVIGSCMTGGKGNKDLMKAVKILLIKYTDIYFVFTGNSKKYNEYKEEIIGWENNLKDRVIFTGYCTPILEYIKGFDIFTHYLDMDGQETFGMTMVEAMMCKIPVIASNFGGMKDIVVNDMTGFLIENNQDYIDKVSLLIENAVLRKHMGEEGAIRANNKFTLEKNLLTFERIIENERNKQNK